MQPVAAKYLAMPAKDKGLAPGAGTAGKRIGLYGGSFNPPHDGHLLVAETAWQRLRLDAVWWLVSPGNPLKDKSGLAPLGARIAACEKLIGAEKRRGRPQFQVTAFEQMLPAGTHSAAMLLALAAANPQTHFVWVMGADNLQNFHLWQDWRAILAAVPLAVIDRPGFSRADKAPAAAEFAAARLAEGDAPALAAASPPAWLFIRGQQSHLSSTLLREKRQAAKQKNAAKNL